MRLHMNLLAAFSMLSVTGCTTAPQNDTVTSEESWNQCADRTIEEISQQCRAQGIPDSLCFGAAGGGKDMAVAQECGDAPALKSDKLYVEDKQFLQKHCPEMSFATGFVFRSFLGRSEATYDAARVYCNSIFTAAEKAHEAEERARPPYVRLIVAFTL